MNMSPRVIHEMASDGLGRRDVHIRTKPEMLSVRDITLDEVARALHISIEPTGVAYQGEPLRIMDGYSSTTGDNLNVYGVAPSGLLNKWWAGQDSNL